MCLICTVVAPQGISCTQVSLSVLTPEPGSVWPCDDVGHPSGVYPGSCRIAASFYSRHPMRMHIRVRMPCGYELWTSILFPRGFNVIVFCRANFLQLFPEVIVDSPFVVSVNPFGGRFSIYRWTAPLYPCYFLSDIPFLPLSVLVGFREGEVLPLSILLQFSIGQVALERSGLPSLLTRYFYHFLILS